MSTFTEHHQPDLSKINPERFIFARVRGSVRLLLRLFYTEDEFERKRNKFLKFNYKKFAKWMPN